MIVAAIAVGAFLYAALAEYFGHRFLMHRKNSLGGVYYNHHILHHGYGEMPQRPVVDFVIGMVIGSPWLILCYWYGPIIIGCIATGSLLYSMAWGAIHNAIHQTGCLWLWKFPPFYWWFDHHAEHHRNWHKNYASLFLFTDYLFRTKA